jgi:hypothetical protein
MKYLIGGAIFIFVNLFCIMIAPNFFRNYDNSDSSNSMFFVAMPQWVSAVFIIFGIIQILFGIQTIRLEKNYIAGSIYFIFGVIPLIIFVLSFA